MEKSKRKVFIIKPDQAYLAYRDMLHHYAMKNLMEYHLDHPETGFSSMIAALDGARVNRWVNLGGQLVPETDVDEIRKAVGSGEITTWEAVHQRYDELWVRYPLDKQRHAFATLKSLYRTDNLTHAQWNDAIDKEMVILRFICDQVYLSRKKDFDDPFRKMIYRNAAEMQAAIGTIDDNEFIRQVRVGTDHNLSVLESWREFIFV